MNTRVKRNTNIRYKVRVGISPKSYPNFGESVVEHIALYVKRCTPSRQGMYKYCRQNAKGQRLYGETADFCRPVHEKKTTFANGELRISNDKTPAFCLTMRIQEKAFVNTFLLILLQLILARALTFGSSWMVKSCQSIL